MNLIEAIKSVPDHRHSRGIRHELWLILTIILLGSCTGYWGYKPLVEFTKNHRKTLIKLFNLPSDTRFPSDSTFRNIIQSLDFEILDLLQKKYVLSLKVCSSLGQTLNYWVDWHLLKLAQPARS